MPHGIMIGAFETRQAKYGLRKVRGEWWLCAVALCALAGSASALHNMALQFTWGTFAFAFDSDQQRQEMSARTDFAPHNATPFDVDVDRDSEYRERFFISFPALLNGSQVALATVKEKYKRNSPKLAPYPDWSWHAGHRGCDGMTSVFRIYIDKCRRLWVIDCGADSMKQKCPPQLLVFDLKTDQLIARHRFNVTANSLLLNVIAEQLDGTCSDDAIAYIADTGSPAIYVFSLRSKRSWRVESDTFRPDSNASRFEINGTSFEMEEGVMGLAQNAKNVYYHSFSSFQEGTVLKSVLRDEALFSNGTNRATEKFKFIGSRVKQSTGEVLAKNSVMFFHQLGTDSIYCWDTSTEYSSNNQHVVEHDNTHLHFVTTMKTPQGYSEEVWAIDNNAQNLFAGTYKPNLPYTVNIVRGSVSKLSSKCKGGSS